MRERFGSKCFRIFRLIMIKKILEQKQVAELAMISGKEAKELLYILLAENFVSVQVWMAVVGIAIQLTEDCNGY